MSLKTRIAQAWFPASGLLGGSGTFRRLGLQIGSLVVGGEGSSSRRVLEPLPLFLSVSASQLWELVSLLCQVLPPRCATRPSDAH